VSADTTIAHQFIYLIYRIGEALQSAFVSSTLYSITVTFYGKPQALLFTPWQMVAAFASIALIGATVQLYMIVRIWYIAGQALLVAACTLLCITRLIALLTLASFAGKLHLLERLVVDYRWLGITAGSVGAASDILITFALFYALWRNKRGLEK
jgi:uncharacterized membrane protein YedE/YeeE